MMKYHTLKAGYYFIKISEGLKKFAIIIWERFIGNFVDFAYKKSEFFRGVEL